MRITHAVLCVTATLVTMSVLPERACAFDVVRVQTVRFTEKTIDQTVFGKLTIIGAERKCRESLQAQIELLQKAFLISDTQRSKLELSGQLDIERFFASYHDIKRKFKFGGVPRNDWQAVMAKMQAEVKPIKEKYEAGVHGKSSLFAKTLARTLDPDQLNGVQTLDQVRANRAYANYIRYTLAFIDPKVPLTQLQRDKILELMLQKTKPPESYGASLLPAYRVLRRMGQIEDQIRDLFTAKEWAVVGDLIRRSETAAKE